jgi:malonyl-CoA O-methyltransferase
MLSKNKIKQSFAFAAPAYDSVALLQRNVGRALLQCAEVSGQVDTVVDLGCGTGFLVHELSGQNAFNARQIIAIDIAQAMLQTARNKLQDCPSVAYLCADAELLPLHPHTMDLVLSNLAFQWCDLAKVFSEIKRILKPNGHFCFTTFGQLTLHELKMAWQAVDDYAHVNTFLKEAQITDFLQQAGFKAITVEKHAYISVYESVWDLMSELKQLGAHTVLEGRNKQLTSKSAMQRMICAYQKQDENGLIPATFEVITVTAKA